MPRGTVKLISPFGTVVSEGIINQDSSFVLPEMSRQLNVEMRQISSTGLWPANYRIQVNYRYDGLDTFARKQQTLFFINIPGVLVFIACAATVYYLVFKYKIIQKATKKARTALRNQKTKKS